MRPRVGKFHVHVQIVEVGNTADFLYGGEYRRELCCIEYQLRRRIEVVANLVGPPLIPGVAPQMNVRARKGIAQRCDPTKTSAALQHRTAGGIVDQTLEVRLQIRERWMTIGHEERVIAKFFAEEWRDCFPDL